MTSLDELTQIKEQRLEEWRKAKADFDETLDRSTDAKKVLIQATVALGAAQTAIHHAKEKNRE